MRLETAQAIVDAAEYLSLTMELRTDYSGRWMFGATTAAVVYDHENDLLAACLRAGPMADDPLAFGDEIFKLRRDGMGRSLIAY